MTQTLYATFSDSALAEKAVGALLDHGARGVDISVVAKSPTWTLAEAEVADHYTQSIDHFTVVEESDKAADHVESAGKHGLSTTTSRDAESGAAKGAGIGLGVGVVAAIASLIVPGFGVVVGGGALAIAIAGAAGATAAGAVAGGVTGYLVDQGVPEAAATDYHRAYENGAAVLSISVPSGKLNQFDIQGILHKYNAEQVNAYGGEAVLM